MNEHESVNPNNHIDHEDIDLNEFNEVFAEAEVEETEFEPIPDGRYQVNIEKVELTRSKNTDKPMLKWVLRVLGPKHQGRLFWRYNLIVSPENIKWLKTDLHRCGLELERISDLKNNLHKLLDVKMEILKKTKGENENIYFNKRIGDFKEKKKSVESGLNTKNAPF